MHTTGANARARKRMHSSHSNMRESRKRIRVRSFTRFVALSAMPLVAETLRRERTERFGQAQETQTPTHTELSEAGTGTLMHTAKQSVQNVFLCNGLSQCICTYLLLRVLLCQIFVLRMRSRALCVFHSEKRTTLEPENGSFFVVSVCAVEDLLDQQIQTHTENTLHTRH